MHTIVRELPSVALVSIAGLAAGAKSVVATLWQVPDEESSEVLATYGTTGR